MFENLPWLSILVVVPVVGALLVWALPKENKGAAKGIALVTSLVTFALSVVMLLTAFDTSSGSEVQLTEKYSWIPQFGVNWALGVSGVGLVMILLGTFLVPIVLLAGWKEIADPNRMALYVALVLITEAFIIAVFAARDVFLFYILFEAMLIPIYFLIGSFGGVQRRYAAVKFLLFGLFGGLVMLAAVIGLFVAGPGGADGFMIDNLVGLDLEPQLERLLFLGFFIAFAIKAPMWPVHTWLPDAAQQANAGTSTLLVGVLDKVGTFGMLTLCLPLFPNATKWAAPVIIVLAVISILYGALLALGQNDIMRLIAYTSVSHFGFIVLGIFVFTDVAQTGATFYMLNHGFATAGLFLIAGMLIARGKTQQMDEYGGMQKVVPLMAGTFLVAGMATLSLPGTSSFVSEFLVLVGTFSVNKVAGVLATTAIVLAALYVLFMYQRVFTGPVKPELAETKDLSGFEKWAVGPIVAALLIFGFYPKPVLDILQPASEESVAQLEVDTASNADPSALSTTDEGSGK